MRDARLLSPYVSIPFEPTKLSIALFIAEFLYHALKGEQQNAPLFAFVSSSLAWLDAAERPVPNFHLVFIMRLAHYIGFYPNLDDYHDGCVFDLRNAVFTSQPPLHSDYVGAEEASHLQQLMRMQYATMHLFRLSRSQRNRILEANP